MSAVERPKSPLEIVEVLSDDENDADFGRSGVRRQSAIEVLSDVSDNEGSDNDLEIVSEVINTSNQPVHHFPSQQYPPQQHPRPQLNRPARSDSLFVRDDDVEITGHNQILLPDLEALIHQAYEESRTQGTPNAQNTNNTHIANNANTRHNRHTNTPTILESQAFQRRRPFHRPNFPRILRRRPNPAVNNATDGYHFGFQPFQFAFHGNGFGLDFGFGNADQGVSAHVLEAIRRSEERDMDKKLEKEDQINRKTLEKKQEAAKDSVEGYTSTISTEDNYVCELCAIVLGEGIPADFKPDLKYDDNIDEHASRLRTNAPWFCIRQCFETDIELLKRVFAAKCGHVFCGRCIKNIANRAPLKGRKKNEKSSILNPRVSSPHKCPVKDCGASFMGKKTFTELYL